MVKKTPNQNPDTPDSSSSLDKLPYTSEIVQAFSQSMSSKNANYFSARNKQMVVKDFWKFVEEEYDSNILQALKAGKVNGNAIDVELNAVVDKGFTLADLQDHDKNTVIKKSLGTIRSESEAINQGLMSLYTQRDELEPVTKQSLKLDDFLRKIGYTAKTDQEGKVTHMQAGPQAKSQSVANIIRLWKDVVRSSFHDSETMELYTGMLAMSSFNFDPTEKVACLTAVRELYHKIESLQKSDIRSAFIDEFGPDVMAPHIGQGVTWTSFEQLGPKLERLYACLLGAGLIDKQMLKQLQSVAITPKLCAKVGEQTGDLPAGVYDEQIKNRKFSELSNDLQHLVGGLAQSNLINNVAETIDELETPLEQYANKFNIPGNLGQFFEKFGSPNSLTGNKATSLLQLKQQEEKLKDQLSDESLSPSKKLVLEQQLEDITTQINNFNATEYHSDWDSYFTHIATKVDEAVSVLGDMVDITGSSVHTVLEKLRRNHRNITPPALSLEEQNILMKASVVRELAEIKNSNIDAIVGTSFEEYAQFILGLYDLTSKQSIITTKDGQNITLDFNSKKFVGKPLEFHHVDVTDIKSLENIRVEFELNLNDNLDAENFIRMMTGGPRSQLIEDFLPQAGNRFPKIKTITDSTEVKMTDKDGNTFRGYLSRYEHQDAETERPEGTDLHAEQSSYILYSEPADKLSTTREIKKRKLGADGTKSLPVYINMDNLADWQDIEIIDKKVTLSDKHLKALNVGHAVAHSTNKSDLTDITKHDDLKASQKLTDDVLRKNLDTATDTIVDETTIEQSDTDSLATVWNALLGDDKDKPLIEGTRLALSPRDKSLHNPSVPSNKNDLMTATVKKTEKDAAGQIVSVTMGFDNLARNGRCTMKDITFDGDNLKNLSDVFDINYLDQGGSNDYNAVLQDLSKKFEKDKSFNWKVFDGLTFDGGGFIKGKEKITKFVAHQVASDAKGKGNDKYDVEYTIEKVGSRYHVKSSPFAAMIDEGKDDNKKPVNKNIIFDTTTDLSGLLLILAGKKLIPYTDKEHKAHKQGLAEDESTVPQIPRKWFGLSTIWNVIKGGGTKIFEQWKKKLDENGKDELNHLLFTEYNVYGKLQKMFGGVLGVFDMDIFDDLEGETHMEAMDYGWKKINGYYEYLSKFHPARNAGVRKFGLGIAYDMMEGAIKAVNANQPVPYKDRLKTAAVLLRILEKMKTGYSKNFAGLERGIFVKILLGPKAYAIYEKKYKELELESRQNTQDGYKKRELLHMLEYNFITDSIRGGPNTDDDNVRTQYLDPYTKDSKNPFYFQNLYSRTYANKLGEMVGKMTSISTDKNDEDIKRLIDSNNFTHVYNECRNHIGDLRVVDAVKELIALQSLATSKEQGDRVMMLMFTGILNGAFVNHLGQQTKFKLKEAMRNSSFPYPQLIEHYDGPQRAQELLKLASANLGGDSFDIFGYDYNDYAGGTSGKNQDKIKSFPGEFESWRNKHQNQISSFLHMDADSLKGNNNLMKIWKTPADQEVVVFGKSVLPFARECIDDMMGELYYNRGRGASLDNYSLGSELSHYNTTIENFFRDTVNKYNGQDFNADVNDHASLVWSGIKNDVPSGKETTDRKYMLAYHVKNFFRMFQGFGEIDNSEPQIATFYKHLRLAQQHAEPDRSRLIWFYMTKMIYSKGPIPNVVEHAFTGYMKYFEENLSLFDSTTGSLHDTPNGGANFADAFTDPLSHTGYSPYHKRKRMSIQDQRKLNNDVTATGERELLNREFQEANKRAQGAGRYSNQSGNSIQMSIDDKIAKLRGIKNSLSSTVGISQSPAIDHTNANEIDYSVLPGNSVINPDKPYNLDGHVAALDPKKMTPEQKKKYEQQKEFEEKLLKSGIWSGD